MNKPAHCDPGTLTDNPVWRLGCSVSVIVFVVPLVKDKSEIVAAGPSTKLFSGPRVAGSYCMRNPLLMCDQSMLPPIEKLWETVVEEAGSVKKGKGITDCGLNSTAVGTATESRPERLKLNVVVDEVPATARPPEMSCPASIVDALVQ